MTIKTNKPCRGGELGMGRVIELCSVNQRGKKTLRLSDFSKSKNILVPAKLYNLNPEFSELTARFMRDIRTLFLHSHFDGQ